MDYKKKTRDQLIEELIRLTAELNSLKEKYDPLVSAEKKATIFSMDSKGIGNFESLPGNIDCRNILKAIPDTLAITDLQGLITYCSQSAGQMFGYNPVSSLIDHHITEFLDPADRGRALAIIASRPKEKSAGIGAIS